MTLEERRLNANERARRYRERHPERAREARRQADAKRRAMQKALGIKVVQKRAPYKPRPRKPHPAPKPKIKLKGIYADLRQWLFDKRGIKL